MSTPVSNIRIIGSTNSIEELNNAYNDTVLQTEDLSLKGVFEALGKSASDIISTLNHITNYNVVRIAHKAAKDYESSGRTDRTRLIVIEGCRSSLKEHVDKDTELELLENLCRYYDIN